MVILAVPGATPEANAGKGERAVAVSTPREDEIKKIAYEIWEREGRPHGKSGEHYFRAVKIYEERQRAASVSSQVASTATAVADQQKGSGRDSTASKLPFQRDRRAR